MALIMTGLDTEAFCLLVDYFSNGYQKALAAAFISGHKVRQRKSAAGRKGKLASMEQELFFILYYLR